MPKPSQNYWGKKNFVGKSVERPRDNYLDRSHTNCPNKNWRRHQRATANDWTERRWRRHQDNYMEQNDKATNDFSCGPSDNWRNNQRANNQPRWTNSPHPHHGTEDFQQAKVERRKYWRNSKRLQQTKNTRQPQHDAKENQWTSAQNCPNYKYSRQLQETSENLQTTENPSRPFPPEIKNAIKIWLKNTEEKEDEMLASVLRYKIENGIMSVPITDLFKCKQPSKKRKREESEEDIEMENQLRPTIKRRRM